MSSDRHASSWKRGHCGQPAHSHTHYCSPPSLAYRLVCRPRCCSAHGSNNRHLFRSKPKHFHKNTTKTCSARAHNFAPIPAGASATYSIIAVLPKGPKMCPPPLWRCFLRCTPVAMCMYLRDESRSFSSGTSQKGVTACLLPPWNRPPLYFALRAT